jgi:PKD repeat protein
MNGNKTVQANFTLITYTLTANNDGHGTVTLNPAGGTYASGATVTLTPVPNLGYQFSYWSGANVGDITFGGGVYRIVMTTNKSVTANFVEAEYIPAVEFWATPTRGNPALTVKFTDASEGEPYGWLWDFGDGQTSDEQNPVHVYWQPGRYSVTLTVNTQFGVFSLEKEQFIYVNGFEFCSCAMLDLIDNSLSFASENWNNAIDHDASGLDGTVTAGGSIPYAIFKFHDNKIKVIEKIRMITDTDVGMEERWTRNFEVYTSKTGLADSDFSLLLRGVKKGGNWEEYAVSQTQAKYIKLVLTNPNTGWRQLGEFEVCVGKEYPDVAKSTITATSPHIANGVDASRMTITLKKSDGSALTGLSVEDFTLFSYSGSFVNTTIVASTTPGVYTTSISTIEPGTKEIKVIVQCKLIGSATITFTSPVIRESALVFVEGSTAFRNEGWDNLIDGDEEGWDGTATVGGTEPFAILAFADNSTKAIQRIELLMDTGVGFADRWVQRFRLQASTTGKAAADFVTVYDGIATGGDWRSFVFPAFNARYLKLVIDFPKVTWRQLGELRVYTTTLAAMNRQANDLTQIGDLPQQWSVSNNYPNPFNPETRVRFSMPEAGHVQAAIYNMLGQKVRILLDTEIQGGTHEIVWDSRSDAGESVPSGVYYLRFDLDGRFYTKKVVLTR